MPDPALEPPAPTPPAQPEPPEESKNVLQSATIWGALVLLEPIISKAQDWPKMTADERTSFMMMAFGVVIVIYGRLRQGDLKVLKRR